MLNRFTAPRLILEKRVRKRDKIKIDVTDPTGRFKPGDTVILVPKSEIKRKEMAERAKRAKEIKKKIRRVRKLLV